MNVKSYICHILLIALCVATVPVVGQNVGIRTDRSQILIGERIQYDLLIKLPGTGYLLDMTLPDSIPHFELLSRTKLDTSINNGVYSLHQTIVFTSFDSGQWYIPSFPVLIQKGNGYKKFETDSVLVNVGYSPADSTNQLRDIKPVMEVEVQDYFWWYVAAAILGFLIIVILIYLYIKKRKRKPLPFLYSNLSPYDEAMQELGLLSGYDPGMPAELKQYHTSLATIIKKYYSRTSQENVLNKPTGDFLLKLKQQQYDTDLISSLAEALRTGDAVKFAKYLPAVPESLSCTEKVKNAIERMHQKNKS